MSIRTRALATTTAAALAVALVPAGTGTADGRTDDVYGFADFYGVPHLGYETASGTGCGGDGSVGDVIPDGYWRGYVRNLRATDFDFDLVCVYGNDVNPDLIAQWTAQHPGETQPWVPDGFMVNNSDRTRVVPTAPGFFTHGTAWSGTSCPFHGAGTPFDQARDTWIRIVEGRALWAVSSCAGVPSGPIAPPTEFSFPYPGFYDVPRLGTEEVLGTGCGGNGSLGETIPDGFWFGWVESIGESSLEFDVACLYIGQTAAWLEQEWRNDPAQQAEDPSPYFMGGWWLVNNNERTRTVPLAPGFVVAGSAMTDPAAPNANWPAVPGFDVKCVPPVDPTIQPPYMSVGGTPNYTASWLYIAGGQAHYALLECPHD